MTPARAVLATVAVLGAGCAGSDADSTQPTVAAVSAPPSSSLAPTTSQPAPVNSANGHDAILEFRNEIGPRAIDLDHEMMMVVDAVETSADDIFVRLRVANSSDRYLDLGVRGNRYGPLLVMRDDLDNTYDGLAVEPAGIPGSSIGHVRFRLRGPVDPDAATLTFELATQRGTLESPPVGAPADDGVYWSTESAPTQLAVEIGDLGVEVVDIVDRGTHLDVSVRTSDQSADQALWEALLATLTAGDVTPLQSLPHRRTPEPAASEISVLRFAIPPTGTDDFTLSIAGTEIDNPTAPAATDADVPAASSPRLPEMIHQWLTDEPFPASSITTHDDP